MDRTSWDNNEIQPSAIPSLAGSHRGGSVRSFGTSQYSDVDSRTSSEDTILQLPDFEENFLQTYSSIPHTYSSSHLSVSFPNFIDDNQEENKVDSDVNPEDVCKEVRCIEIEESSTNRYVESNISDSSANKYQNSTMSSPATSGLTVVEHGDGKSKELELPLNKGVEIPFPEKTSQWLQEKDMYTPLTSKLKRSRSCKASLMTSSSSFLFEMVENNEGTPLIEFEKSYNESTPPIEFEKTFAGRPMGLQKKLVSLKYDGEIKDLRQNGSQASRISAGVAECKPQNTKSTTNDKRTEDCSLVEDTKDMTTTDEKNTEIRLVEDKKGKASTDEKSTEISSLVEDTKDITTTDHKITENKSLFEVMNEKIDTKCSTQLADYMAPETDSRSMVKTGSRSRSEMDARPIPERGLRSVQSEKDVKNVGLDPMPMDEESHSKWPSKFLRLQREIVKLWHGCNISLVPSDSITMEVELRRLSFLKGTFLKGNQALEDGPTPASSLKALCSERHMLSKQMSKRLSKDERNNLYLKWGIGINSKNRRLQLSNRLWSDPNNMDHITDSANVVAKLVGSVEPEQAFKEMFGLRFTPRDTILRRRSNRWVDSLRILGDLTVGRSG